MKIREIVREIFRPRNHKWLKFLITKTMLRVSRTICLTTIAAYTVIDVTAVATATITVTTTTITVIMFYI